MTFSVPTHERIRISDEGLPNFHQRPERIGPEGVRRLQRRKNGAAPEKRLEIRFHIRRKIRGYFVGEPLLVSYPFEQLRMERRDVLKLRAGEHVQ